MTTLLHAIGIDRRMDYALIKLIHQSVVVLSGLGFAVRGIASLCHAPWVQGRLAKTLPHGVDTALLGSALTLAWLLQLNPLHTPWLMAKILGLLVYIALGMVALRPQFSKAVRVSAWVAALVILCWIASVAITKNPLGFLLALIS
jgi:uncharacterized membrane protein SirB2